MDFRGPLREIAKLPALAYKVITSRPGQMVEKRYAFGPYPRQYLMTFEAPESRPQRDLVIYFLHGGGWRFGSPEWSRPLAYLFTELGYAVVMPSYRLIPEYNASHMQEDSFLALKRAKELAMCQGKRFLVIGESAGGNLASLLIYNRKGLSQYGISQDDFAGFISIAGVLDLDEMPDSPVLESFAGPRGAELFQSANPITYLEETESVPILIVQGSKDGLVPLNVGLSFYNKMKASNPAHTEFHVIKGASHMETCQYWFLEKTPETLKILKWIAQISA